MLFKSINSAKIGSAIQTDKLHLFGKACVLTSLCLISISQVIAAPLVINDGGNRDIDGDDIVPDGIIISNSSFCVLIF